MCLGIDDFIDFERGARPRLAPARRARCVQGCVLTKFRAEGNAPVRPQAASKATQRPKNIFTTSPFFRFELPPRWDLLHRLQPFF